MGAEIRDYPYDPVQMARLLEVIDKLEKGQNLIYTKYGDGEYNCMIGLSGHNIDHDSYHSWLGQALKNALVSLSKKPNTYIGKWWHSSVYDFCDQYTSQYGVTVPWAWYHLVMNDDDFYKFDYMYKFVQFIVNTKRKKILVCNYMNNRLKQFFRADVHVEIPPQNWSFEYDKWKNIVEQHMVKDAIVLISAGMCSKVLIDDITNNHDATFIDLGSSFDLLGRMANTRGWRHTYQDEWRYYRDFIPSTWTRINRLYPMLSFNKCWPISHYKAVGIDLGKLLNING